MDDSETKQIRIECTAAPKINLALQQNAAPVLRELRIINETENSFGPLRIEFLSDPNFCRPHTWHIEKVGPEQEFYISELKVDVSPSFLSQVQEATRGLILLKLFEEERLLAEQSIDIDLLAPNEWGGITDFPEILAAFSLPNDPAVSKVLKTASEILQEQTGDDSLNGYQSGSRKRVSVMVAAIYYAIGGQRLTYIVPPSSFEKQGQKIRLPSQILETRLATCLDLTLLFTAACEQAGLYPIVVLLNDHAFPGCWLQQEGFSISVVDDVQVVRKRLQLKELVVFESTFLANTPLPSFAFARSEAAGKLQDKGPFQLAIGIQRARIAGIRPLSNLRVGPTEQESEVEVDEDISIGLIRESVEDIPDETDTRLPEDNLVVTNRLVRWQRKLLDLTLRNPLLNFRNTKRVVEFICPEPTLLEDMLADGVVFKIRTLPDYMGAGDPRNLELYKKAHGEDAVDSYIRAQLVNKELLVREKDDELQARLTAIFRAGRDALNEGGANELFLALGFLHWKHNRHSDRILRAPLILLPVELSRKSVNTGFRLKSHDDEARVNPTLLELLRQDYELEIQELEGDLPTDEHGLDVARIWRIMQEGIRDIQGWEVKEQVELSIFSFSKYLMWKDLRDRTDQLRGSRVVSHLIDTPRDPYQQGDARAFVRPEQLDTDYPPQQFFCPLETDSSQLTAIAAISCGKDLVLIGPPGTGKSQTISNLICQCLAEGKKVLFVSEKTAALNVVYRRLKDIGLGPFCLELHSNRARKSEVLRQLDEAWSTRGTVDSDTWERQAQELKDTRDQLNMLVERLHYRHSNGWTAFRAASMVIRHKNIPVVSLSWPAHESHDEMAYRRLEDTAKKIDVNRKAVGELHDHPLRSVGQSKWSPSWQANFVSRAKELQQSINTLTVLSKRYVESLNAPLENLTRHQLAGLAKLHGLLQVAPSLP